MNLRDQFALIIEKNGYTIFVFALDYPLEATSSVERHRQFQFREMSDPAAKITDPGQWAINAWPTVMFTIGLLAYGFYRAAGAGYSPVGVLSTTADRVFVKTVQARWRAWRKKPDSMP
jgi:hypothetical protein